MVIEETFLGKFQIENIKKLQKSEQKLSPGFPYFSEWIFSGISLVDFSDRKLFPHDQK